MARKDKTWLTAPFLLYRDNLVRWHVETKHGHPNPFCYPKTIKSNGTWRQNLVIRTLFAIQRQSSPLACGEKTWSSAPFMLSRDNHVRLHAETKHGHPYLLCHPDTIKSDGAWRQKGHSHHFCNAEIVKSDAMRRQNMVIRSIFATRDNQV